MGADDFSEIQPASRQAEFTGSNFGRTGSANQNQSQHSPRTRYSLGRVGGHSFRAPHSGGGSGRDHSPGSRSPGSRSPIPKNAARRSASGRSEDSFRNKLQSPGVFNESWTNKVKEKPTILTMLPTTSLGSHRSLSNHSGGSSNHLFETMNENKKRSSEAKKKAAMQAGSMPWLTISVSGRFRQAWDFLALLAVIYCTFIVPLDMCFNLAKNSVLSAIDISIEALFLFDIIFNFFTSYLNDDGDEITSKTMIAQNYLKTWFPIDASSSIPAESITRIAESFTDGSSDSIQTLYNLRIIRIVRLTKLLRLLRLGKLIEMIELSFPSLGTVVGLIRLLFMMLVVGHIQACGFYWVGSLNIKNSWVSKYHYNCCDANMNIFSINAPEVDPGCFLEEDTPPMEVLYADAIYWSFATLTTVGYGDITPCNEMEMLFSLAAMVVGSAIFAYIIGNISYVVTSVKGQELKLRTKMRELQEYIALRRVPKAMADVLRRQCLHRWKRTVFDEQRILKEFTPHMRREVVSLINDDALLNVATFKQIHDEAGEEDFITDLAIRLRPSLAQALDEITQMDQYGGDLYIITSGQVQLVDKRGKVEKTLGEKQYFNELELFAEAVLEKPMPYVCTARAVTNCELYILRKNDFHEVYENYLEANPALGEYLEQLAWQLWGKYEEKVEQIMKSKPSDHIDATEGSGYYNSAERQIMEALPLADGHSQFNSNSAAAEPHDNPFSPKMEAVKQYKAEAAANQLPQSRTSFEDAPVSEDSNHAQVIELLKMIMQIKDRVKGQEEELDRCLKGAGLEYQDKAPTTEAADATEIDGPVSREGSNVSMESLELSLQQLGHGSPGKSKAWMMHSKSYRRLNIARKHYRHLPADADAKDAIRRSFDLPDEVLHAVNRPGHFLPE